ncbi:MAG: NAD(P)-dependent oxidoreductase [Deltaproteobacteria bacterium]|jgi:3-hydroxyisobutyrate dehydrogenase-like beta-hydroxyacid dehydrogenase|nr:NAD(P)-dependent oxidoreductase [Deltaproteobacteria bacterium]
MKTVFLGLGRMGSPMARTIAQAGLALEVCNRDPEKAKPLADLGLTVHRRPEAAFRQADLILTMVSDDLALTSLATAERLALAAPSAVHVSLSTVSVELTERLAALHASLGLSFAACPVFGRPEAAAAGALQLCLAGPAEAKERARPWLNPLGRVWDFGLKPAGAVGVKLAGNFMIASLLETLAEAFSLTEKHGVAPERFFELMSGTLFDAPAVKTYGRLMLEANFENAGFPVRLGLKDIGLVKAAARDSRAPMPLASLVEDRLLRLMARGWGELDWSSTGRLQREDAGLAASSGRLEGGEAETGQDAARPRRSRSEGWPADGPGGGVKARVRGEPKKIEAGRKPPGRQSEMKAQACRPRRARD